MKNPFQVNVGSLDLQVSNLIVLLYDDHMSLYQACHSVTQIIEMVDEAEKKPLVCYV